MDTQNKNKMTLVGFAAIVLWGSIVGLIRYVSEAFGPVGGAALIYSLAALILLFVVGIPRMQNVSRRYFLGGSVLFVAYELCLALSIGYATSARQAIEVGMVNYLWPTFTLVAAILFNQQKTNALIFPGVLLSLFGVFWVVGGDKGFDLPGMLINIQDNPLSYGLAFIGAIIWAAYSLVTAKYAQGKNGITLFVILVAGVLWCQYLFTTRHDMAVSPQAVIALILAAAAMGLGYAAWNIGMMHGNVTILAGASYFTPVLSASLAAFILGTPLSFTFWQGTMIICGGSVLSWLATQRKRSRGNGGKKTRQ